jgi:hypothetical protein
MTINMKVRCHLRTAFLDESRWLCTAEIKLDGNIFTKNLIVDVREDREPNAAVAKSIAFALDQLEFINKPERK